MVLGIEPRVSHRLNMFYFFQCVKQGALVWVISGEKFAILYLVPLCIFYPFPLATFKTDLIICIQQSGYDLPCIFLHVLGLGVFGYSYM